MHLEQADNDAKVAANKSKIKPGEPGMFVFKQLLLITNQLQ